MNELTQVQYEACFGMSNRDPLFESELLALGIKYTMRRIPQTYPMVLVEQMPIEYAEVLYEHSVERLREMRKVA